MVKISLCIWSKWHICDLSLTDLWNACLLLSSIIDFDWQSRTCAKGAWGFHGYGMFGDVFLKAGFVCVCVCVRDRERDDRCTTGFLSARISRGLAQRRCWEIGMEQRTWRACMCITRVILQNTGLLCPSCCMHTACTEINGKYYYQTFL